MKNKSKICLLILIFLISLVISYKIVVGNEIRYKTYDYLETKGYTKDDISNIIIKHSFINRILSYNEWRILVEFKSEPNIIFAFTYRNNEIIKEGVNTPSTLDKEEMLEYDNKFDNGEL